VYRAYLATLPKPRRAHIAMRFAPVADVWRTKKISDIDTKTFREFYAWRRKAEQAAVSGAAVGYLDVA
jgi:hypothetical protein